MFANDENHIAWSQPANIDAMLLSQIVTTPGSSQVTFPYRATKFCAFYPSDVIRKFKVEDRENFSLLTFWCF